MIYLDHAATTPCAQEVIDAMLPLFRDQFANASSTDHVPGGAARRAVEEARSLIAALVGARSEDVIFTSGSTEANNLALSVQHRVASTALEHPSIVDAIKHRANSRDTLIKFDKNGLVTRDLLAESLADLQPTLLSVIATNNETGAEQDITMLAEAAAKHDALLHLDATQAIGTRAFSFRKNFIDGMSISAHKIGGPKGVGALIASPRLRALLRPIQHGGGHERGFRSGTLNVPGIVGFGIAAKIVHSNLVVRREHIAKLRRATLESLQLEIGDRAQQVVLSSSPHILALRLNGVNGRALLGEVRDEVAFSLGSACATNKSEPSHVLLGLGYSKREISESIRISFSSEQTIEEVAAAGEILGRAARKILEFSSAY